MTDFQTQPLTAPWQGDPSTFEEPISPELALVQGVPAGGWPAKDQAMVDPLDARRPTVPAGTADASSVSVEALLFQAGLITADQLGELVRDSVILNRPAAEVALERGLVSSAALQQVLAQTAAPAPDPLPLPLPAETAPLHAVVEVEAPPVFEVEPPGAPPVVAAPAEPPVVAEPPFAGVPDAPPALASQFLPEALQALLTTAPTVDPLPVAVPPAHDVSPIETPELPPVALPEVPVEPALPAVVLEQSPPVIAPPVEPTLPAELPLVEAVLPVPPALVAEPPAEPATPPVVLRQGPPVIPVTAEPIVAAEEPLLPAPPAVVVEPAAEPAPAPVTTSFAVLLRLQTGERIAVDSAASFEAAAEIARGLADRFARATEWPLLGGRCIRPDAVVSVDIERTLEV